MSKAFNLCLPYWNSLESPMGLTMALLFYSNKSNPSHYCGQTVDSGKEWPDSNATGWPSKLPQIVTKRINLVRVIISTLPFEYQANSRWWSITCKIVVSVFKACSSVLKYQISWTIQQQISWTIQQPKFLLLPASFKSKTQCCSGQDSQNYFLMEEYTTVLPQKTFQIFHAQFM